MKQSLKEWLSDVWDTQLEADFSTGYSELDRLFGGGFRRQHLTILGARPSVGKTTFMVGQAVDMARRGVRVGICSVERPGSEIVTKACTYYSGGDPKPTDMRAAIARLPMWIDDTGSGLTPSRIRGMVDADPIDILYIDYLQLLGHERRWPNRNAELDAILQELQALHKEYQIQIVLLTQLSRGIETRRYEDPHARPEMRDCRDSGAIEQMADEIILMHRDDMYRECPRNDGITEFIIAKNRLGPIGTFRLTFIPEEEAFV